MGIASIATNIQAGYAAQNLRKGIDESQSSAIRMSSGMKITKAADDASGLSIGTGLRTDVATLKSNISNASQAGSILSIADGAMSNISDILQRMKALASQANSGAMSMVELGYIDQELDEIAGELQRITGQTSFNGQILLDGTYTGKDFQVGFGSGDVISVSIADIQASTLTVSATDLSTSTNLATTITRIDNAIDIIKSERASIGAQQSRFNFAAANLETSVQNTDAARADYLDADLGSESSAFSGAQVRIQAGISVLAQVNQLPQSLLKLLG